MTTKLLDLHDRIVTDTGAVVAKYDLLLKQARSGIPIGNQPVEDHPDVRLYAIRAGKKMKVWKDDGNVVGPDPSTYAWNIPQAYQDLDVIDLCLDALEAMAPGDETYQERLSIELAIMEERGMFDFIRCLIYIRDTFQKNDVVWGIGRGSSVASLVLFLLGINRVDPVRYDIPLKEFYK